MPSPTFAQVTPHIFKLELPLFNFPVGVFLVRDDDGWTLIDAGVPGAEDIVLQQILAQTGRAKPKRLLLTHGHYDHGAAAARLHDEWRTPIAAGRAELPYLVGAERYRRIPSRNPVYPLLQGSPPALFGRSIQLPLDEGVTIDGMEVFHVTGHAPGMVALLHRADRALICGDTFTNLNGRLGDPPSPFTYDMALNRQAQAKLAALDFDHLLVSHGAPILNEGRARAQELLANREKEKARFGNRMREWLLGPSRP